jgi:hypothetical protein
MPDNIKATDNLKIWQLVLKAAQELDKDIFTASDIIKKIHETRPDVRDTSIRAYVIAMAPAHPSYHHYPTHHPCFEYLGDGKYKLMPQYRPSPFTGLPLPEATIVNTTEVENGKRIFAQKYENLITAWISENHEAILNGWKNYRWGRDDSLINSLERRNRLTKKIALSRIRNNGGLDLETLDSIMEWGFPRNPQFTPRNPDRCIVVTQQAFNLLDEGKPSEAICKLMTFPLIISRASKIIGLSDVNYFAIYDSRVGLALANLMDGDERLIKIPGRAPRQGKTYPSDICSPREWGQNYQRLMWVLEIMRNVLNQEGYPFSLADVEMALFMMGR